MLAAEGISEAFSSVTLANNNSLTPRRSQIHIDK